MGSGKPTTIVLGTEYDHGLRAALLSALRVLGAQKRDGTWDLAGSQEIAVTTFNIGSREIVVEAETGDSDLVEKIAALVKARISDLSE